MSTTCGACSERVSLSITIERTTRDSGHAPGRLRQFERAFSAADANRDGAVDRLELSALYEKAAQAGRPAALSVDDTIDALDTDGDRAISRDEFWAGVEALDYGSTIVRAELRVDRTIEDSSRRRHHGGPVERLFSRLDANADGGIDADEIGAELNRISARTGGAQLPGVDQVLARLDTDRSGAIGRAELRSALERYRRAQVPPVEPPAATEPPSVCMPPPAEPLCQPPTQREPNPCEPAPACTPDPACES